MLEIKSFQFLSYTKNSQQWPQFLAVLSAILSVVGCGLLLGCPSPFIPKLLSVDFPFKVSSEEASFLVIIAPLGYIIGCPLTAWLSDVIGRKRTTLLLAVPQIIAWTLFATASSVMTLCVARIVSGIGEGSTFTVLPMYLGEISEPKIRGMLATGFPFAVFLGVFLINCYGSYVTIKTSALVSLVVPVLFIITFMWMPESPYYFLMKGKKAEARESLKTLRRMHDVEKELEKLTEDVNRQISQAGTLKDVFVIPSNRKACIILAGLRAAQQLGGFSFMTFYIQTIFEQAEESLTPAICAIISTGVQVIVVLFSSVIVDKYGRKPIIIGSCSSTGVLLIVGGIYFFVKGAGYDVSSITLFPVMWVIFYIIVYSVGLGTVPTLMMSELLSANIKGKAICLLNFFFAFCTSFSSELFHFLETSCGMFMPFLIFGSCCLIFVVFIYLCVPETTGKSLEEIQQLLRNEINKDVIVSLTKESTITRL